MITLLDKSYQQLIDLNLALSCSCGKDSVATAILCLEKNIPLKYIVRYDNGADWSCMNDIWERLKLLFKGHPTKFIVLKGTTLLYQIKQKHEYTINNNKYYGYVPCGPLNRFGTTEKIRLLENFSYSNKCTDIVGIAFDEDRILNSNKCYLLKELFITERQCLELCYKYGFYWEQMTDYGFKIRMYDYCSRLSCIYCGFCNSQQLALICALFDKSILPIFEKIQMKLDVPFKDWSSVFNFKERLKPKIDNIMNTFMEFNLK